jgi:hypothetical protein
MLSASDMQHAATIFTACSALNQQHWGQLACPDSDQDILCRHLHACEHMTPVHCFDAPSLAPPAGPAPVHDASCTPPLVATRT